MLVFSSNLSKVLTIWPCLSHFDIDLSSSCWNIVFRIQRFGGNCLFPITIFPEEPKLPLALAHFSVLLLEAPGSGLLIIPALRGIKGKVASFSRLLGQQAHSSPESSRWGQDYHLSSWAANFGARQPRCPRLTYIHRAGTCSDCTVKHNFREPMNGQRESG